MFLAHCISAFFNVLLAWSLVLSPQGNSSPDSNLSSGAINDVGYLQLVPLPVKPLFWRIGGSRSSQLFQLSGPPKKDIVCNAQLYGQPGINSCYEAWTGIPDDQKTRTFGDRTAAIPWDVPLPFRFISGQ